MLFKIGMLTCSAIPELGGEDIALMKDLNARGHQAVPVVWNKTKLNREAFDCLLFRSVWDYHKNINEFLHFLNEVQSLSIACFNPVDVVRENLDKHYLEKLQQSGLRIIPSLFLKKGRVAGNIFSQLNTADLILKPTISAGSYKLHKFSAPGLDKINDILLQAETDYIAQPYMDEIRNSGELSLVFIGGSFSHAMRKMPAENEFRVQKEYGGRDHPFQPDQAQIDYALRALNALCGNSLYARIDCLMSGNDQFIMEVELFEPLLYLDTAERREKLISALENRL